MPQRLDLLASPSSLPGGAETLTQRVARYFRAREGVWLDVQDLAALAGIGGWRSRVAELRFPPYGMVIDNRQLRWEDGRRRSQYRYRRASTQGSQAA